jgi:integrase
MAAVIARIAADQTLSKYKVQQVTWALRAVSKAMGHTPADMRADPRYISKRLVGFTPAMAGLSVGTWTNAVSFTRFAFRHVGIIKEPAETPERFAPEWTALLRLMGRSGDKIGLSRMARYCTSHNIGPEDVDDTVFSAFLQHLTQNAVVKNGKQVHRRAAKIWNNMVQTTRGWPNQIVSVPSYSRIYFLGWDKFPQSLTAEINRHLDVLGGKDILEPLACRPLKPRSIRTRRLQLGAYLSALVIEGVSPLSLPTLAEALRDDLVLKGLRFFMKRAPAESTAQAHDTARMLLSVARHWLKQTEEQVKTLKEYSGSLDNGSEGLSERNRIRLRQFDDADNVLALLKLPKDLVRAGQSDGTPTHAQALLVQTALAVELLLMVAMRRSNLTYLNIDKHLTRSRKGDILLFIPGCEVKNEVAVEVSLPKPTVQLLDLYLTRYRPVLLAQPSPWLFPGVEDRAKSPERLALQISDTIKERLGLLVNVHLFRHLMAKIRLQMDPGNYAAVKFLLGHKNVETTAKFYCSLEAKPAAEHYDNYIIGLREGTLPARPGVGR